VEKRLQSRAALASTVDTVNGVTQVVRTRDGYAGVIWSANAAPFADLHVLPLPEFSGKHELLQVAVLAKSKNPTAAPRLARYLACDQSFLDDVQDWFETGVTVARNPMVLVVPKGNPKEVRTLDDLARPELRVGLGHPENAAIGKIVDQLLRKLGLYEDIYSRE